jgi:hypothetical protein
MTNPAKIVVAVAVLVLVAALAVTAFLVGRGVGAFDDLSTRVLGEGEVTRVGPVTVTSLRALAELTTYEMVEYTIVEKADDRGWLNWATGDSVSMFVVARIGAGIDFGRITTDDIEADPETGIATIRLPGAAILYVDVDEQQTNVFDRATGIFTRGNPNLEQSARIAAEEVLVDSAVSRGLLDRAEDEAITVIRAFVESLGYADVRVVVGR